MARRKQEAAPAPTDLAEATLMMGEFVAIDREIALEKLAAAAAVDRIEAQRDARLAELQAQAKPLFAGLKAWWEAGGKDEVAKGKCRRCRQINSWRPSSPSRTAQSDF